MEKMNIKNLSQAERLEMSEKLLDSVWEEMSNEKVESLALLQMLQTAANCSISIRRIVWLLNKKNEERYRQG